MRSKILIIVASIVVAFCIGSLSGVGYYYFAHGTNVVGATPLENSPPVLKPEITNQKENERESDRETEAGEAEGDLFAEKALEMQPMDVYTPERDANPKEEAGGSGEGAGAEKVAYITIDDGPDPQITPIILDVLEQARIKATFFVLGTSIEKNPELLKQIFEAGHVIGNHTYNHRYKDIYASDEGFWNSVKQTEDLIINLTGSSSRLIREPGGRFLTMPKKQAMVREQDYGLVHWNIDSYDSRSPIPDAKTIFANVKRQAGKEHLWPAMVLLFHDAGGHQSTAEALPLVIEYLREEGFSFKTIAEMEAEVLADLPRP